MANEILSRPSDLRPIDRHLARYLGATAKTHQPECAALGAEVSRALGDGHAYATLRDIPTMSAEGLAWDDIDWASTGVAGPPGSDTPLIIDGGRAYLHRLWHAENDLAEAVIARVPTSPMTIEHKDPQERAARHAASRPLTVVTGGPGTGKTTTVAKILSAIAERSGGDARVGLAAPTGKAARRLQAAVEAAAGDPDVRVDEAVTLHRLLGFRPSSGEWRYGRDRSLPYDAVIVDEVSMIDLSMMRRLFASVAPAAHLVLLGDRDQLVSIDAGTVFADLASLGELGFVCELKKNYRFHPASGIAALAKAVREGDAEAALALLRQGTEDLTWEPSVGELTSWVPSSYEAVLRASDWRAAVQGLDRFRVLCGEKRDAEKINRSLHTYFIERDLAGRGRPYFHNQPVIATRNDYAEKIFNGEVGLLRFRGSPPRLRAGFESAGELRTLDVERLPACETAYAITIHKSQGSEYERAVVVLPPADSRVISRELLYTGVTRAARSLHVVGSEEAIASAVQRPVSRQSALAERVRGKLGGL